MKYIVETCEKHGVPVGHPHVTSGNVEKILADGYRFIMSAPVRTFEAIQKAKALTGKTSADVGVEQPEQGAH